MRLTVRLGLLPGLALGVACLDAVRQQKRAGRGRSDPLVLCWQGPQWRVAGVRRGGIPLTDVRTVAELAGLGIDLAELREVRGYGWVR